MSVVANVAINVDSRNAVNNIRAVNTQAKALQGTFNQVATAARGLQSAIVSIGIAGIVGQTVKAAASFNDLQKRLRLLTSEYGEYNLAQQFAAKAAKQFGLSNREAATGVADIYGRLRPLGVSLKDIQSTFNGFNTIARLSGISAEGASAAFLQLGQALGSGQLQGDEFRSIAEQVPGLLVAVSKETGIAAKDLKQFASDGKLSAEIVINALKRIESEGSGKIAGLVNDSDVQRFKNFQNAVDDLSVAIGNELLPVVTPLIQDVTKLVQAIADLPGPVKSTITEIIVFTAKMILLQKAFQAIISLRAGFVAAMLSMTATTTASGIAATKSASSFALYTANTKALQSAAVTATPALIGLAGALASLAQIGIIAIGIKFVLEGADEFLTGQLGAKQADAAAREVAARRGLTYKPSSAVTKRFAEQSQYTSRFAGARDAAFTAARQIGEATRPSGVGGGSGGAKPKGKSDAEREAARALEVQKQQLKAADDQNFALKNRFAILQETEAVAKRELELDIRLNEIAREYDELKANAKSNDELILINASSILEKKAAELEAEREINDLIAERVRLMAQLTQEAMQPTVYNELETQDAALQSILDKYPAIGSAADAAATMATSGIQAMIAGTKSAEQVFIEFLSSIADALIDTAKQMIAQYIAIGIARIFAGMGSKGGGDFAASGPLAAVGNVNTDVGSFFTGFAEGGFVTGPTRAVVGEGGEPEYIIPASKMSAAMKRYGGGSRGSAVIPTSGDTSEAGGTPTAMSGAIDVRYTVERINSVDYVTADQFQQGMQQAATQGAQRGEQQALRRLQNSASTRRRLGV